MRRRGRQEEQSDEVPEQVFTGRQNPVPEELYLAAGSTGGSAADGRVEQLATEIGEIRLGNSCIRVVFVFFLCRVFFPMSIRVLMFYKN